MKKKERKGAAAVARRPPAAWPRRGCGARWRAGHRGAPVRRRRVGDGLSPWLTVNGERERVCVEERGKKEREEREEIDRGERIEIERRL